MPPVDEQANPHQARPPPQIGEHQPRPAPDQILGRLGVAVTGQVGEAENGPEALREIGARRPDLAFLDIQMPGLTGLEVAEGIEGERWLALRLVTVISTMESPQEVVHGSQFLNHAERIDVDFNRVFEESVEEDFLVAAWRHLPCQIGSQVVN